MFKPRPEPEAEVVHPTEISHSKDPSAVGRSEQSQAIDQNFCVKAVKTFFLSCTSVLVVLAILIAYVFSWIPLVGTRVA